MVEFKTLLSARVENSVGESRHGSVAGADMGCDIGGELMRPVYVKAAQKGCGKSGTE